MSDSPTRLSITVDGCSNLYIKSVAKALLYTILFHRCFGQVVPKTEEILDISIPIIDDQAMVDAVEQHATDYAYALQRRDHRVYGSTKNGCMLRVDFYEKKVRKNWFSRAEEDVCWETWNVAINNVVSDEVSRTNDKGLIALTQNLQDALLQIVEIMNQRNDHYIPPIPYNDANPFTYHIAVQ